MLRQLAATHASRPLRRAATHALEKGAESEQVLICQSFSSQPGHLSASSAQPFGNQLQRLLPAALHQLVIPPQQRDGQSLRTADEMMPKTAFVTQPNFVHLFVLARHDAFDDSLPVPARAARVQVRVAAHCAVRAYGGRVLQFPWPRAETEIGAGERANRAYVRGVAGEMAVEAGLRKGDNLQRAPALIEAYNRLPDQFILKTGAARALDATLAVKEN